MQARTAKGLKTKNCSIDRFLSIIGDPWNFLVIRAAFFGLHRFEDFQRSADIPRRMLARCLARYVELGILKRERYQERPERYEYRLTPMGFDTYWIAAALMNWGDRWLSGSAGAPLLLRHDTCKKPLHPVVLCSHCGEQVSPDSVAYENGPGAGWTQGAASRMRRSSVASIYERGRACSAARALNIVGNRWTGLVLREAFYGARRFEEFRRRLNIARNILSDRLEALVSHGVLAHVGVEYRLTPRGLDFYPCLLAMLRWGDKWFAPKAGVPLVLRHSSCGKKFTPIIACRHCGQEIRARDVTYRDGPGASAAADA